MECFEMYMEVRRNVNSLRRARVPGAEDPLFALRWAGAGCQLGSDHGCREVAEKTESTDSVEPAKVLAGMELRLHWMEQGCTAGTAAKSFAFAKVCATKDAYADRTQDLRGRVAKGGLERPMDHTAALMELARQKKGDLRGMDFSNQRLQGIDLAGAQLDKANFTGANLSKAKLTKANLTGATFDQAKLTGANFSDAAMEGARFRNLSLAEVDLGGANLKLASFDHVDLDGTVLRSANLLGARFVDSRFSGNVGGSIFFEEVTFTNVTFDGVTADGWDLQKTRAKNVTFRDSKLNGVKFTSGKIDGLTLQRCEWSNSHIAGVTVSRLQVENSQLKKVRLGGTLGPGAFVNSTFEDVKFMGPSYDTLSGVSFCKCPGCRWYRAITTKPEEEQSMCLDTTGSKNP